MSDDDPRDFAAQLAALVADLDWGQGVHTELGELIESAGGAVPGAPHVGISLARRRQGVHTVVATRHYPAVLDEIQHHYQEGPCLTAAWEHRVVHVNNRWPRYQREAIDRTPIRSVLAFELFTDSDARAALNCYSEHTNAFSEESVEIGLIFAANIALAWPMLRRIEQFRSALASRDSIGQAKGIIMERYQLDAVRAFELLKHLSQRSKTKLVEVAQGLIDAALSENRGGSD